MDMKDIINNTVSWQFNEARMYGGYLAKRTNEEGWTPWVMLNEQCQYQIRGKVRNSRGHICNPMVIIFKSESTI